MISGVSQGSILCPILVNVFPNDLLEVLKNYDIYFSADDSTILGASKNGETLLETLKNESELVVNCFRNNNMIVNPDKFQFILLQESVKQVIQKKLQIDSNEVKCDNLVMLLGITIYNRLSLDDHISKLDNKASMQLNSIFRQEIHLSKRIGSFIYSNFNYCPLVWHFNINKSIEKMENMHKRCLRL